MTTELKWTTPESIATALSTELNSLANGSYSAASSAIDNATGLYQFIELELYLASLTPVSGQSVTVYLLASADGTNYASGGGSVAPPSNALLTVFDLRAATATQRRVSRVLEIPPLSFKLVVGNASIASGVAFASSGNTLKYRRFNVQAV
ncbi:MAG: hypothetical protein KDI56_09575 [Xanthomonadales bacterium]|nr:hypothetical protein [Caldilinea sp.]MCB1589139.1 hypothetical protein [Xanthomonadales bacterium]